jgi:hypothetical protein
MTYWLLQLRFYDAEGGNTDKIVFCSSFFLDGDSGKQVNQVDICDSVREDNFSINYVFW